MSTAMERPEQDKRRALARSMRADRYSYREIGERLGVTRQRAHQLVNDAPKETRSK